jgi:hypothetical protein
MYVMLYFNDRSFFLDISTQQPVRRTVHATYNCRRHHHHERVYGLGPKTCLFKASGLSIFV